MVLVKLYLINYPILSLVLATQFSSSYLSSIYPHSWQVARHRWRRRWRWPWNHVTD